MSKLIGSSIIGLEMESLVYSSVELGIMKTDQAKNDGSPKKIFNFNILLNKFIPLFKLPSVEIPNIYSVTA
jgi:hypothetical protein